MAFETLGETNVIICIHTTKQIRMAKKDSQRVEAALEAGKCLSCDKPGSHMTRGLCSACYQAARRAIRFGRSSENDLVTQGKMLPKDADRLGRPPQNPMTKSIRESLS